MQSIFVHRKQWIIKTLLVTVLGFMSFLCSAQTNPTDSIPGDPGAISVYTLQNMSFGAFTGTGAGGTVIISTSGTRSVTGNVVALNLGTTYFQSIFEISAPSGTIVSLINGPDATLTGSNGGSMLMHIGSSNPASPFITTIPQPGKTQLSIGGTLTVGNPATNPPGTYHGTFFITFNQE